MPDDAFYFGCFHRRPGHYLHTPGGKVIWDKLAELPWKRMDAVLCPGTTDYGRHIRTPMPQPEGAALLHHRDGWTALAFWDRSGDSRYGGNSVFFLRGTHDFEGAVTLAKAAFPCVWARIKFDVRLA